MSERYRIRLLETADYPQLAALWQRTEGMGLRAWEDSAEGIAHYLARNPQTGFAACLDDGSICGCVLAGHDGRRGFIYHLAVAANRRRQGIARALVETAMAALRREGIRKAAFLIYPDNREGMAFWQQMGFAPRQDVVYCDRWL